MTKKVGHVLDLTLVIFLLLWIHKPNPKFVHVHMEPNHIKHVDIKVVSLFVHFFVTKFF
jgi:hypothetical protein